MNHNELGQYIPLHYHFQMLSDHNRVNAFEAAIKQVIKPSHKVVELGSGTGILSYFAARVGASVLAVENNAELVNSSRDFIKINEISDQVKVTWGDAKSIKVEEVDVIICEMLHSALLREKQVEVIARYRDDLMKQFHKVPIIIPSHTFLAVQPIYQNYNFNGFIAPVPLFQDPYQEEVNDQSCCDPIVYQMIDYQKILHKKIEGNILFTFECPATINALRFITKNVLSIDTREGTGNYWNSQHLILPLGHEIEIMQGQSINLRFEYMPGDSINALNDSIIVDVI